MFRGKDKYSKKVRIKLQTNRLSKLASGIEFGLGLLIYLVLIYFISACKYAVTDQQTMASPDSVFYSKILKRQFPTNFDLSPISIIPKN